MRRLTLTALFLLGAGPVAAQEQARSPHGGLALECATCHQPESWTAIRIDDRFDHGATRFPLGGAHRAAPCRACHESLDFAQAPSACAGCHTDEHRGELGPDCARCHGDRSFADRVGLATAHQLTRFSLTGAHLAVDCVSCHQPRAQGQPQYVGTPTECVSCHRTEYAGAPDHAAAPYPTTCEECHRTVSWTAAGVTAHPTTPIALTGVHSGNLLACTECHVTTPYAGVARTCDGCHQDDYLATTEPPHAASGFGTDCASCHPLAAGWAGATFDHPTTPIALSGVHGPALVNCAECHTAMPYSSVPRTCDGCHQDDYLATTDPNHAAAAFASSCTDCHALVAGWTGARFLAHDGGVSIFLVYSGKHLGRWDACSDCHTLGQPYASTAALRCLDCHAEVQTDKHAGQNYTPSDCVQAGCHANGSKE